MTKSERRTRILETARRVMEIEGEAVLALSKRLDDNFVRAAELLLNCQGRAAVIGIGKSGIIGRKIAATMASTGTQAIFVHPVECLHGDLGMLSKDDVIIALSYSGETSEVVELVPALKNLGLKTIAMTGSRNSSLARMADITLACAVKREACPINSAPTASTTAMLAMGDALAIALMKLKNFGKTEFARLHPGGSLGRVLTFKVSDMLKKGLANPVISEKKTVSDALFAMTQFRSGAVAVVNARGKLTGYFTDGDLRRGLQKNPDLLKSPLTAVMTVNPSTVTPDTMAADAAEILRSKNIDNMPVVDAKGRPLGLLDERDLLAVIPIKENDA